MSKPPARPGRPGAPWWVVVVLAVAVVGLLGGLVTSLVAGDDEAARAEAPRPTTRVDGGRDARPIELPREAGGLTVPESDPTGLDRGATVAEITDASGAGADVATYVDGGAPAYTVTAVRLDALPLFTVRRPPEEAADVVTRVRQAGRVRCQTSGPDGGELVLQCQRSAPGLTVSVVPMGDRATDVRAAAAFTDAVWRALRAD